MVNNGTVFRSGLDGSGEVAFINEFQALEITIDFISGKFYWTDASNTVWESNLNGSSKRMIFSDDGFKPFKIEIVRNYILLTSLLNNSYALINLKDFSITFHETPTNTLYYGVSAVSSLRKPSLGQLL